MYTNSDEHAKEQIKIKEYERNLGRLNAANSAIGRVFAIDCAVSVILLLALLGSAFYDVGGVNCGLINLGFLILYFSLAVYVKMVKSGVNVVFFFLSAAMLLTAAVFECEIRSSITGFWGIPVDQRLNVRFPIIFFAVIIAAIHVKQQKAVIEISRLSKLEGYPLFSVNAEKKGDYVTDAYIPPEKRNGEMDEV